MGAEEGRVMVEKKTEIRLFIDGAYIDLIDEMIKQKLGGNRSEIVRMIVQNYFLQRGFKTREERLKS